MASTSKPAEQLLPGYQIKSGPLSVGSPIESSSSYPGFAFTKSAVESSTDNLESFIGTALNELDTMFGIEETPIPYNEAHEIAKVDIHLKKAIVNHLMGQVDNKLTGSGLYGLQGEIYDDNVDQARRLATVVKPQLQLIQELNKYIRNMKSIRDNPEYDMCYKKLSATLNWLIQESESDIQDLLHTVNVFDKPKSREYQPTPASKILRQSGFMSQPGIKLTKSQRGGGKGGDISIEKYNRDMYNMNIAGNRRRGKNKKADFLKEQRAKGVNYDDAILKFHKETKKSRRRTGRRHGSKPKRRRLSKSRRWSKSKNRF